MINFFKGLATGLGAVAPGLSGSVLLVIFGLYRKTISTLNELFRVKNIWNNIDVSSQSFVIPNWNEIIEFAKAVATKIYHTRLLAMDICLDKDGKPKEVPELCIETESQRAEWEAAQRRKAMHIQRKKEGF